MKGGFKVNGNTVLYSGNYNSYAPSLTGAGASGTWAINVTGNAATASGIETTGASLGYSIAAQTVSYSGWGGPHVRNQNDGGAAMMSFVRQNMYGVNFGLDTDNKLKVGGWSMGGVSHEIATVSSTQTFTNKTLQSTNLADSSNTTVNSTFGINPTVATTATTAIDSFPIASYRSAKYTLQITQGSTYQISELLLLQTGSTAEVAEFVAISSSGTPLGTFSADVSGGNARLLVTMASAASAAFRIERVSFAV